MSDDLDNLLRAAMKTLDEQVPSGYFEALPNQTLARLEGSSMQHGPGTTGVSDNVVPPPMEMDTSPVPKQAERDEDSGLHDIRNLAQSTKQRLSKRGTQNPPIKDEDALASSSGSWKNIALPQPAKMVSLPELAELPSKKEVLAAEKASKKAAKSAPAIQDDASVSLAAVAATDSPLAASASTSIPERAAFSLPSQQNKRSKAPLFAILGVGVAAAAGGVIYMQMNKADNAKSAAPSVAQLDTRNEAVAAKAPEPTTTGAAAPAPERAKTEEELKAEADLEAAKAEAAKAEAEAAAAGAPAAEDKPEHAKATKTAVKGKKQDVHKTDADTQEQKVETKPEQKDVTPTPPKKGEKGDKKDGEGEPSFDALLKEAGVDENKKNDKPKLEKKSLTGDDFKTGMAAVASKAQACYKGTQGTASVKLTISPSGAVSKVTVGGAFAGKPEAACVEAAVKGAKFPPWDGGQMSFTYAYMLSD